MSMMNSNRTEEREWSHTQVDTYLADALKSLTAARRMIGDSGLDSSDLLLIAQVNRVRTPLLALIEKRNKENN